MGDKKLEVKRISIRSQKVCKKCVCQPCQRCMQQRTADSFINLLKRGGTKDTLNSQKSPHYHRNISSRPFPWLIYMPIPVVAVSIARLETLTTVYTSEYLKEKNEDYGGFSGCTTHSGNSNRIHTHRLLSDYTPIPRSMPTPPPTPLQRPSQSHTVNFMLNQPK